MHVCWPSLSLLERFNLTLWSSHDPPPPSSLACGGSNSFPKAYAGGCKVSKELNPLECIHIPCEKHPKCLRFGKNPAKSTLLWFDMFLSICSIWFFFLSSVLGILQILVCFGSETTVSDLEKASPNSKPFFRMFLSQLSPKKEKASPQFQALFPNVPHSPNFSLSLQSLQLDHQPQNQRFSFLPKSRLASINFAVVFLWISQFLRAWIPGPCLPPTKFPHLPVNLPQVCRRPDNVSLWHWDMKLS